MAISQITNRGPFLVYESNAVRINNEVFPAKNINVGLSASLDSLIDIDGNVPRYAPNGALQGVLDISFDLTGALPTYFQATGITEAPVRVSFNNIFIYAYLQNLSFSVQPYQPITINSSFAFYHGIRHIQPQIEDPYAIGFDSSLKTYNGAVCRLVNQKGGEKLNYSLITNLDYSLNVDRVPYTKVGYESPTRVTVEGVNTEMILEGSNIDKYMSIRGNPIEVTVKLNELYSRAETDAVTFDLNGRVVEQSFAASQGAFGIAKMKAIQTLSRVRDVTSIPFIDTDLLLTGKATPPELLDFGSQCPTLPSGPGIPGEEGDGFGQGGWTPPGGGDPGCDDGDCGDDGGNGTTQIGDGPAPGIEPIPDPPPTPNDPDIPLDEYYWAAIYVLNDTLSLDKGILDVFQKASSFKDDSDIDIIAVSSNYVPAVVMSKMESDFVITADASNYYRKGYIGIHNSVVDGDIAWTDCEDFTLFCAANGSVSVKDGYLFIARHISAINNSPNYDYYWAPIYITNLSNCNESWADISNTSLYPSTIAVGDISTYDSIIQVTWAQRIGSCPI